MTPIYDAEIAARTLAYKWSPFSRSEVLERDGVVPIVRGHGSRVVDVDGREYLDAHGGLWLMNVGYGRQEIVDAVARQMAELPWFSSFEGFTNAPSAALAERLVGLLAPEGMSKVFFSNSGTEAVETAFKIVRQYWHMRGEGKRYKIIARNRAYHGVSFAAIAAGGLPQNRVLFEPVPPGFVHAAAPDCVRCDLGLRPETCGLACARDIVRLIECEGPATVAAVIVEPVQGAGGVIIPPPGYLEQVRDVCTRYGIPLIFDEVVTGFGRTGTWFGARTWNVKPDIITMAKGLTSGYVPLGATAVTEVIYQTFRDGEQRFGAFRHGNTYSGHPVACAAALANLDIIEREDLVGNARRVGAHFLQALQPLRAHAAVSDVAGIGLIGRICLRSEGDPRVPAAGPTVAERVVRRMRELGVIARALPFDILSYSPPLCLTVSEADTIAAVFHAAIQEMAPRTR